MLFNTKTITGRVAVSKIIGFIIGGLVLLILPLIPVETTLEFKIGFVLLIMAMSITIGFMGIFTYHPAIPQLRMPWWLRGGSIGLFYFLILILLAKDSLEPFLTLDIVTWTGLTSPYWALIDGMILGMLIGYVTTKICGEGNLPLE